MDEHAHALRTALSTPTTFEEGARSLGVNDSLDDLVSLCTSLHETIEALTERLSPVLVHNVVVSETGDRVAAARERSIIAARIDDEAARVASATDALQRLLHRLDV